MSPYWSLVYATPVSTWLLQWQGSLSTWRGRSPLCFSRAWHKTRGEDRHRGGPTAKCSPTAERVAVRSVKPLISTNSFQVWWEKLRFEISLLIPPFLRWEVGVHDLLSPSLSFLIFSPLNRDYSACLAGLLWILNLQGGLSSQDTATPTIKTHICLLLLSFYSLLEA